MKVAQGPPAADREALRQRWYAEGWYGTTTLGDELRARARNDATIVFASADARTSVGPAEVIARGERVAAGLARLGVGAGDVVAIQTPTSLESAVAFAGVWSLGGVVLPVVPNAGVRELGFVLGESRARAIVVPDEWRGTRYASRVLALSGVPDLEHVIVIGDDVDPRAHRWRDLEASDSYASASDPDAVCLLVYTSGTTAAPKGVQHTHNTLLAGLRGASAASAPTARTLATFPAGHIAGALGILRALVGTGVTVVMDRWSAAMAAELIEEYGILSSAGTPFFLSTLLDEADRTGRDIGSLRLFLTGAASVPPALLDRARARGIVSWRTYGSTEHPAISSGGPDDPARKRHFTDGRVTPGSEIRLVDEAGNDVDRGRGGEIVARGPKQFIGYRDPRLDAEAFRPGGWFRTGDIGRFDDDGYLVITDRKKDIIIRAGENISSKEVEDILLAHPAVSDAAVCATPDPLFGERVCAFVVLRHGRRFDLQDVEAHFDLRGIARYKAPTQLELVADLPRTETGKIKKAELRDRLHGGGRPA